MKARLSGGFVTVLMLLAAATVSAQTRRGSGSSEGSGSGQGSGQAAEEPAPPPPPVLPPGISERTPPAWQAIQRGHRAFQARDFDTALAAYREAAMATPPLPIAHYFIGAAQRAKGLYDEALESFRTCSRLAGDSDAELKAKSLFNIAMTHEQKKDLASAKEAWLEYKTWCTAHASIIGFPQVADERVAAIEAVQQLNQTYEAVRQRIADRERVIAEQAAQAAMPPAP